MKKINVSQAEGPVLDWLVATLEGWDYDDITNATKPDRRKKYSTDWSQGGPIIEREQITLLRCFAKWRAEKEDCEGDTAWAEDGPTMLVAGMRCFVASKLGEIVEVPEELK